MMILGPMENCLNIETTKWDYSVVPELVRAGELKFTGYYWYVGKDNERPTIVLFTAEDDLIHFFGRAIMFNKNDSVFDYTPGCVFFGPLTPAQEMFMSEG